MKTIQMEVALANHFKFVQNLIVTNVSWGLHLKGFPVLHECDLLICTSSNFLWEVEIKVSKNDLIKDKEKWHGHYHNAIKRFYFAIPEKLQPFIKHIPKRAGIIVVKKVKTMQGKKVLTCVEIRKPKIEKGYKITNEEKHKLAILGAMRVWGLKRKLIKKAKYEN